MFDSKEELLARIRLGEDSVLELKSMRFRGSKIVGPSRESLARIIRFDEQIVPNTSLEDLDERLFSRFTRSTLDRFRHCFEKASLNCVGQRRK
jgi:hypothetical protein